MRTRLRDWPVWLMSRLWIADKHVMASPVRLSLPWHGEASWDDMHAYVKAVIEENTVPSPARAGYGPDQAGTLARSILLSTCHRLGIEPVGAFVYHLPAGEREEWEALHGERS